MLATFLASTPLLSESWKLCSHANATAPRSFVTTPVGDVAYVAFSGVQPVSGLEEPYSSQRNLVALDNIAAAAGLFSEILLQEPAVKVHAGFLHLFLSIFNSTNFQAQGPLIGPAKDCLTTAKRMGRTPNLNSATLAVTLSKINPFRAQIEWYKASCDASDDQLGYYDTFKLRGASKRDAKVNMNRIKLARFWDNLIRMLDANQLPHDFHKREKWVNAAHSYKLLVEPLDIAEYYRTGMHRAKGHYLKHGRQRRYEIFDKWWRNMNRKRIGEEEEESYYYCKRRSRFASLTQDSCFWARVEEAREWLENVRSENDARKLSLLWDNIHQFEQYTSRIVDTKEVSPDVLARNSSYSLWVKELGELKLQLLHQFPPHQFPGFSQGEVVP